jgi:hypothetical protein
MHGGQDARKHAQRVLGCTAEQAGMQVAVGAGESHLLVNEPAQRCRHHGRCRIPHARIAHQRQVQLEFLRVVLDEAEQVVGAALLLALDHHGDGQRQFAGHRHEGATGLDEGHYLAFVVAGPARDDDFAAVGQRRNARCERRCVPEIERIDRLDVVVAVEQDARALAVPRAALADDDRVTFGLTNAGLETNTGQILGHKRGGRLTFLVVRRVGRDRLDAQKFEQALETLVEPGVDFLQHGREGLRGGHVGALALV